MFENLRDTQALFWIDLQQSSDEVLGLFRDFFLHVVLGLQDLLVEVFLSQSRLARVFSKSKVYQTTLKWMRDSQSHWPPLR